MADEIQDPALEGVPDEAFETEGDRLTPEQLAVRVHLKREQAMQDAGWLAPPGPDEELEPVDEAPAVVEEEPAAPVEEEEEPEAEPGEPEEPEDAEEEPLDEGEVDDFYVARYKDRETAEEALAEKDRTIQRLYQEINQGRELAQQNAQQDAQPEQLDTQAWSEWAAESVENGAGIRGAQQALQAGGPQGFDIYMAHWLADEDPESRVTAMSFNNEVQRQYAAQSALQAVEPKLEESQQRTAEEEAKNAEQIAASARPDFAEYREDMDRLISEDGPIPEETKFWLAEMAGQGVEGKVRAWDYLYLAAVAARGPRRQQAQTVEKKRRTERSDAAKIAATVSSAEGTGAHTPPSAAESYVLQRRNAIREKLGQPLLTED